VDTSATEPTTDALRRRSGRRRRRTEEEKRWIVEETGASGAVVARRSERMSTGALLRPISRWVGTVRAIEITSSLLLPFFDRPSLK
jgi:hypothetical protein